jgi:hypothetical protein
VKNPELKIIGAQTGRWSSSAPLKIEIPEITDAKLFELAARIKPLHIDGKGKLRYVKVKLNNRFLRETAYTYDPKYEKETPTELTGFFSQRPIYHRYGYYGSFNPSVAEVLAQILPAVAEVAVAFEITQRPNNANDLNRDIDALNKGFHVSTVTFYRKAN